MKIVLLHTKDAVDGEDDPVLGQIEGALHTGGHETRRVMVDSAVEPLVTALMSERPDLVINLAESFAGKSALESNIAALLNLLDLRYTGSSPAAPGRGSGRDARIGRGRRVRSRRFCWSGSGPASTETHRPSCRRTARTAAQGR